MKKLREGGTIISAIFMIIATAITFFFSVQRQVTNHSHRKELEAKTDQYNELLRKVQIEERRKKERHEQRLRERMEAIYPPDEYYK